MMSINITQYRRSVGILNNRNVVFRSNLTSFIGHKCWSTNQLYFKQNLPVFLINSVLFLVSVISVISLIKVYDFKKLLFINAGYYRDVKLISGPKHNTAKKFLSSSGTLIALLHINLRRWSLLKQLQQFGSSKI